MTLKNFDIDYELHECLNCNNEIKLYSMIGNSVTCKCGWRLELQLRGFGCLDEIGFFPIKILLKKIDSSTVLVCYIPIDRERLDLLEDDLKNRLLAFLENEKEEEDFFDIFNVEKLESERRKLDFMLSVSHFINA